MNNSTILAPSSVGLSKPELWIQLLFFYLTIGGWATIVANGMILTAILNRKNDLQSRFFVIVAALSIVKGLLACQTVIMTLYRIFRTLGYVSINQTRLMCLMIHFLMPPLFTVEVLVLIVLVIDRGLAILASNYYRHLTSKQIALVCLVTILLGSITKLSMAFGIGNTPMLKVISCVNVASPVSDLYQSINANLDLALVLFLLISYGLLMIAFRIRSSQVAANETVDSAAKRQKKVVVTMRNVVLIHCAFTLTAKIILTLGSSQPGDIGIRLMAYGGMITQCDEFVNVIALMVSYPKLREICLGRLIKSAQRMKTYTHGHGHHGHIHPEGRIAWHI